jgi:hypothetical protein
MGKNGKSENETEEKAEFDDVVAKVLSYFGPVILGCWAGAGIFLVSAIVIMCVFTIFGGKSVNVFDFAMRIGIVIGGIVAFILRRKQALRIAI